MQLIDRARAARKASREILSCSGESRTFALRDVRLALEAASSEIFDANKRDMERSARAGVSDAFLARLKFDKAKLLRVRSGIQSLERWADPMGRVLERRELDKELILSRVAGPIGVIGMIFESRPDALIQMATLCIRSGNAVILKGGSEALETNRVLARIITSASLPWMPEGWIGLVETREDVVKMLSLNSLIDLLVPRGSNSFVADIMKNSSIPVLGHADGICHVYLDESANAAKAIPIVLDSKLQYRAVCNAAETLLIHRNAAKALLPPICDALQAAGCEIRGCARTLSIVDVALASDADWDSEYLDAIISIRVVDSIEEAIRHIHAHGSGHTEAIVSEDAQAAEAFLARVDAANVFHNCSTRFSDGFVFGLGAEVGISTSKIHARGPVGVEGLLSYRWQLRGSGQIIADYNEGRKTFTHREL